MSYKNLVYTPNKGIDYAITYSRVSYDVTWGQWSVLRVKDQGVSQKKKFCPLNVNWERFLTDQSPCVGINCVFCNVFLLRCKQR